MSSTSITHHKASKGSKGEVAVFEDGGRLKVNLPRQYFGGKQIKKALNLKATDENWAIAYRIAKRMTLDLQEGCFDETLVKYGVKASLKLVSASDTLPPKPKLGTLEIWDLYLEYKRPTVKETYFVEQLQKVWTNAISNAIDSVGDDAIAVRNWLLSNRCLTTATSILKHLSHAYQVSMKRGLIASNPFLGIADDLPKAQKHKKVNLHDEDSERDLYDPEYVKKRAFTVDEVNSILEYVKHSRGSAYYPLLQFLFLTGCRTNEAIALMWGDVKWDKKYIAIQRSYSPGLKKYVSTKTGHIRLFPMPEGGELWQLLKSLDLGVANEIVFKSKKGGIIDNDRLGDFWRGTNRKNRSCPGVISELIKQGKVSKYLPPYNTRHTFISYQINECGVAPHLVKDWCGHSEDMTTRVYRQEDFITKPGEYSKKTASVELIESSEFQALKQQNEILLLQNQALQEQMKSLQELVASLAIQTNKSE